MANVRLGQQRTFAVILAQGPVPGAKRACMVRQGCVDNDQRKISGIYPKSKVVIPAHRAVDDSASLPLSGSRLLPGSPD